jgi:hypothetical protein
LLSGLDRRPRISRLQSRTRLVRRVDGGFVRLTPKALGNLSPGLERSDNPGIRI